jgi:hypothetical protein
VIVLIWANVHGSFVLGPLAVGLAWLADLRSRRQPKYELLAVALLSSAAACVTPFGPSVWRYAVGLTADPSITGRISEWQRTVPMDIAGLSFYLSVVAVALLVIPRRSRVTWPTVVWLLVFAAIGIYAVRGIAWWALAAVPPVASLLAGVASGAPERLGTRAMQRANVAIVVVLAVIGLGLPLWRPADPGTGTPASLLTDAPSGVTASLRSVAHARDRLFNPQPWGSWFEYAIPNVLVAVDSRVEILPASVWAAYDAVRAGTPGWEQVLSNWGVDLVATAPEDADFFGRLRAAGWSVISSDDSGSLLRRPA